VCPPPAPKAGGYTHSPGGEGGWSIFLKTPDKGLASYSIISLLFNPTILRHCRILRAADDAVLNKFHKNPANTAVKNKINSNIEHLQDMVMRTVVDTVPRIPCTTDPATFHGMKKTIFLLFLI
jgi:hypothetical protein